MSDSIIAQHVIIEGRVQGVGFRAWTAGNASKRGLAGWVRNCADGSVEAVFQGSKDTVEAMIDSCWSGPLVSKVIKVTVSDHPVDSTHTSFLRLPNA